jgi:hypothetical protein
VFLDESGVHVARPRTHAWVKRGTEYLERVPMNWGKTLTLLGALRYTGWVGLQTMFATANAERFVGWLTRHLLPRLRRGDVLVMDNLRAHHDRRVVPACRRHGVRVLYLPPYSPRISIQSSPRGRGRNSTSASTPRAPLTTSAAWPVGHGIASRRTIVATGSDTLGTRLNSGDPWD